MLSVPTNLSPTEAMHELVARHVSRLPEDVIYLLQVAAVAGQEFEADIVADASELVSDRRLEAFDLAEESRLLRRIGDDFPGRYAFNHTLVRDAIYGELLRGRRVSYHHKITVAIERAAAAHELDNYVDELAYHFYMGAALADGEKAVRYCLAAGEPRCTCSPLRRPRVTWLEVYAVAEQFVAHDQVARCGDRARGPGGGAEPGRRRPRRPTPTSRRPPQSPAHWATPVAWPRPRCVPCR